MILLSFTLAAHAGDADKGKALYGLYCTTCHGAEGKGDGPAGAALDPSPSDFTTAEFWSSRSAESLAKVITGGGAAIEKSATMPAWGAVLNEEQVGDVIAHLESLKPAE